MFRIVLASLVIVIASASVAPNSQLLRSKIFINKEIDSPDEYFPPSSEMQFLVSIVSWDDIDKDYTYEYIASMISQSMAITFIFRRHIDFCGKDNFFVDTNRYEGAEKNLHHICQFGNFDKNAKGVELFYTGLRLGNPVSFLQDPSQFPIYADEQDNGVDYLVGRNSFHPKYKAPVYSFAKIKVVRVDDSKCLLRNDIARFCISTTMKDCKITAFDVGSIVFHNGKIVGLVEGLNKKYLIVRTLKELGINSLNSELS